MQTPPRFTTLAWLLALLTFVLGCTASPTTSPATPPGAENALLPASSDRPASPRLTVIATHSILGDLAHNVGGDKIELHTLVGPVSDAHTFDPSPADSVSLAQANLLFENGLNFEGWLDTLYTASRSQATRVVVTTGIKPLSTADHDEYGEADQPAANQEEHGHDDGEFDPHVWHDVSNVITMVETIRDALVKADPANAPTYMSNADTYLAELRELDSWIQQQVESLPPERRKLVTSHDTFGYFARRYGFEVVGSALGSNSTEAADPSAGELAHLVEAIKQANVPAIFTENVQNSGVTEQIAAEAGVKLAPTLYTDALGEPGSAGDSYLKLMRYNVTTIVTALQG
jgi:zinc/manganese transport system substrate-binding protein